MNMSLIWAFICLIIFVAVLAHPKLPNWMTFVCIAPIAFLAKVMDANAVYNVLNSSSLHLMVIICMFSGMIAATGLDVVIGDFLDRATSSQTGKRKEMMIFAIVYVFSGLISTVLQNSYVALAFLPVLKSIARKNRISLSKLVLFVIFSTTLGGAITLIGTPTNVYANSALEEAGLALFGMLDFAWVGIPIFILGGIYMVVMNRWCKSYDDFGEDLSTIVPMMGFPLMISAEKGFVASARNFAQHVFVPNDGAVETYCTIVIEPEENVNGLKIYKNDEEFVLF